MASKPVPLTKTPLIAKARLIIARIAVEAAALREVEAQIIALGAGRYCDENNEAIGCTVAKATEDSTGAVSYSLPEADGEQTARKLAGDEFSKLFDRRVSYSPCAGFELLAPKLLTPAKSRDLIAFCLVPGKTNPGKPAHIRWGRDAAAK